MPHDERCVILHWMTREMWIAQVYREQRVLSDPPSRLMPLEMEDLEKKHLSKIAYLMCICQMPGDIECLSGFKGRHRSAFICKKEKKKRMNTSCVHTVNYYECKGNWILRFIILSTIPSTVHNMKITGFNLKIKLSDLNDQWRSHWGVKGGRVSPLTAKNLPKIRKKREKIGKKEGIKEEKSGRKGKNWDGSFILPLLTDRAGYGTVNDSLDEMMQSV